MAVQISKIIDTYLSLRADKEAVEAKAKELAILPFIKPDRCEYSGLLSTSSYAS